MYSNARIARSGVIPHLLAVSKVLNTLNIIDCIKLNITIISPGAAR